MQISFKKSFFSDLQRLPNELRSKVQQIVLVDIPALNRFQNLHNIKKLAGYKYYYRMRIGAYRIGFKYESDKITFFRILHRKEIYKYFP